MAIILRFPKRHARARSLAATGSSSKSSAVTAPPDNSFSFLMVDQSGRTTRRRIRLTVTREQPIAEATASSSSLFAVMKSERCAMPDLYTERTIPVKAKCTPRDIYGDNGLVHDMYMAGIKGKKTTKASKVRYEPCKLRAWRDKRGLSQHELSDQIGTYLKVHGLKAGHSYSIIGRIERGIEPYNQIILQAAAHVLKTNVKSLLFIDPPAEGENEPSDAQLAEFAREMWNKVNHR